MTPGVYQLSIYCGDSYRWQFKLWTDAGKTQPVDLSGVTAKAEIRDRAGGKVLGELVCLVTLPNIIDASIDAVASQTLRNGVWDLQLTYAGGDVSTVLAGPVKATIDVTNSTAAAAAQLRSVGR